MASRGILIITLVAAAGLAEGASIKKRKITSNSTVVAVPSELLLRLLDVTHSLHKLIPLDGRVTDQPAIPSLATPTGLQGTSGEERILTLALTQHALLQHRMEQLLTQTGRCQAQVEALKEDKEELKREAAALKERVRQILNSQKSAGAPTPKKFPAKSDSCVCIDDVIGGYGSTTTATLTGVRGGVIAATGPPRAVTLPPATAVMVTAAAATSTTTTAATTTTATTAATTESVVLLGSGVRVKDCAGHQLAGAKENGVYEIYPSECRAVRVFCDLTTAGGGWTVFLNRQENLNPAKPQENFTRKWEEYKHGFGDVTGEYWLGNEYLHQLTAKEPQILRVDAEDFEGSQRSGEWRRFKVEDESQGYKLLAVFYDTNSTLGDGLLWHSGMQFSTIDRDNDKHKGSCAHEYKGGFWYNVCHNANPTGVLINSDQFDSVGWVYWSPKRYKWASLRYLALKLRPKSFGSASSDQAGPGDCSKGD